MSMSYARSRADRREAVSSIGYSAGRTGVTSIPAEAEVCAHRRPASSRSSSSGLAILDDTWSARSRRKRATVSIVFVS